MAKGGDSQRSNGSRFSKPYNVSNSFVTKVASRVSNYIGGWFGTPLKSSNNAEKQETTSTSFSASGDTSKRHVLENVHGKRSLVPHSVFDDVETVSSPSKRFKISEKEKIDIDFPISPIPSTSGLFQRTINHTFDISKREDIASSDPGPSSLRSEAYSQANIAPPTSSTTTTDVKANGATDNHSDSSESTSGCSSLVPQSDRLLQSGYVCSTRKRNLEEKLKYARQLQQSRAALYLNRSMPVSEVQSRKKPSFDVTAYGTPSLDKSLLREKLINSPFYTGQTSYGGASAYRLSRNTFYSQRSAKMTADKREGTQVQVKPSHHGSTEDLTNMSHTAKKILEALEQFSTPVSDAKRIPINRMNVPLGTKRRRFEEGSETRLKLSTPISPLNPNPSPVITGLNVPTVPDLLKLKRLERIQNSTAAARQVAVQKQDYKLPSDVAPEKPSGGKIVSKLNDKKKKKIPMEKLEEVNLPKIPLPITTLPKFDFQLPAHPKPEVKKPEEPEKPKVTSFKFSSPIPVSLTVTPECSVKKNNFTFSDPLRANEKDSDSEVKNSSSLTSFMSSDAVAKLKRRSINDNSSKLSPSKPFPTVSAELKTGSVMDFLNKNKVEKSLKSASGTWECGNCLIRNLNDSKICCGCKAMKVTEEKPRTTWQTLPKSDPANSVESKSPATVGFGDKFKPPSGSWSCKECFVNNNVSAAKCVACESPKPSLSSVPEETAKTVPPNEPPKPEAPKPVECISGFGDQFKKQANEWECSVCMIRNKEVDTKCVACETPRPGAQAEKVEPKFTFGIPPGTGGFKFGIDTSGTESSGTKSAADSSTFKVQTNGPQLTGKPPQFNAISTSVGVFTFGIPPTHAQDKSDIPKPDLSKSTTETTTSHFLVSSTSGTNLRKEDSQSEEKKGAPEIVEEKKNDKNEVSVSNLTRTGSEPPKSFFFGTTNKSPNKPIFGAVAEENKSKQTEPDSKAPKFFFGANTNSLETVSSSTTDLAFGQGKSATSLSSSDSGIGNKPAPGFQFSFGSNLDSSMPKPTLNLSEANKTENTSVVSTSAPVTTTPSIFAPTSIFNDSSSKMPFGIKTTASSELGPKPATPFGGTTQFRASLGRTGFNQTPTATQNSNSFSIAASSENKPNFGSAPAFGITSRPFPSAPNPFGSTAVPSQSQEQPKTFGGFGSSPSVPNFSPAPAFGSGFMQSSTAASKPAPFIFSGSTAPETTAVPAPATATAPGVFTFGASKPDTKPAPFVFGQSASPNFSFGSNAPPATNNSFGAIFGQTKPENSLAATSSPFENLPPSLFGQNSAPATFDSTAAPNFKFGATSTQQETNQPVFQFGATPSQPVSAPAAGSGFGLSVPQKFEFTEGQTAVFNAEPVSAVRRSDRKMIKAVRRTNREVPRRPN